MSAPERGDDLDGSAPDSSGAALVLIDVINDLEFPGGDRLLEHALPMARSLAVLKRRCREVGIPAVYVNDNFGKWQEDQRKIVAHALADDVRGRPMVELLVPDEEDYFVIKPKHSGFYSTILETLLAYLHARTLIVTGITADICVLFTANDAYMRDYRLIIPSDCVAAVEPRETEHALAQMRSVLKADTRLSPHLDLAALACEGSRESAPVRR